MAMGVPYDAALKMPKSLALALLLGGRPHNTRPEQNSNTNQLFKPTQTPAPQDTGRRLIATRRAAKQDKS